MRRVRGGRIALITQDPASGFDPVRRVGDQLAETLRAHADIGRAEARERAARALAEVGVDRDDHPHRLSGGQRQRAMIAMALAPGPAVLLADEPTASLDPTLRVMVLDLIARLRAERGLAVLLISHDIGSVARIADRVAVMREGRIVEQGPADGMLARRRAAARSTPPAAGPGPGSGGGHRCSRRARWCAVPGTPRGGGARGGRGQPRGGPGRGGRPGGGVGQRQEHPGARAGAARRPRRRQRDRGRGGRDGGAGRRPGGPAAHGPDRLPGPLLEPRSAARSVGASVAEPLEVQGSLGRAAVRGRVVALLEAVGLLGATGRPPSRRALGRRAPARRDRTGARAGAAGAGARRAAVVARRRERRADRPTCSSELRASRDLAYLLISHDLGAVRGLAQRVVVMEDGRIVEQGPTASAVPGAAPPAHPALLAAAQDVALEP